MTFISQITRGLKTLKGLPGFGKLATKGTKTASSKPLSMSPLSNLGKHLGGPKKDVLSLASKTPKVSPAASHALGRTSPAAPSTPRAGDQLARLKSTSSASGQPIKSSLDDDPLFKYLEKHHGARRADAPRKTATNAATSSKGASGQAKATTAAVEPKALTPRERLETLRGYKTQQQEIMQNVKKLENNPHLTPEVKSQLLREEAIKLAGVQKKNAALLAPHSVYQKAAIQNQKILQANVKASQNGSLLQLADTPVRTAQERNMDFAGEMAKGRALRAQVANREEQRLGKAWAADANAMAKPQAQARGKNPYIDNALEARSASRTGDVWISDIVPVRPFPGAQ